VTVWVEDLPNSPSQADALRLVETASAVLGGPPLTSLPWRQRPKPGQRSVRVPLTRECKWRGYILVHLTAADEVEALRALEGLSLYVCGATRRICVSAPVRGVAADADAEDDGGGVIHADAAGEGHTGTLLRPRPGSQRHSNGAPSGDTPVLPRGARSKVPEAPRATPAATSTRLFGTVSRS